MQQWNKSILAGCLLIAVALVIAGSIIGQLIADNLGKASSHVPGGFTVSNADQDIAVSDYMSIYEAAQYCRIDYSAFEKLVDEGKLAGTYAEIPVEKWVVDEDTKSEVEQQIPEGSNGAVEQQIIERAPQPIETSSPSKMIPGIDRVFLKIKLDEWMIAQVGS